MAAICPDEQYAERIAANPANGDKLANMDPQDFIAALARWRDLFVVGKDLPVLSVQPRPPLLLRGPENFVNIANPSFFDYVAADPNTRAKLATCIEQGLKGQRA